MPLGYLDFYVGFYITQQQATDMPEGHSLAQHNDLVTDITPTPSLEPRLPDLGEK